MPTLIDRGQARRVRLDDPAMPSIDPRIRERLLSVQKAAARRRRRWLLAAGAVAAVMAAGVGATRLPALAVHHVRVSGESHTSPAEVLAATGLGRHPLMVDIGTGRLRAELEALPWVATASVRRQWPTTIDIRLTERVPVAVAANRTGGSALLDRSGRVLSESAAGAAGVPTITGLAPVGAPGSFVPEAPGVPDALALAAALPGVDVATPSQIQAIVVADGSLDLTLSGGATVTFGTADDLGDKLLALHTVLQRVDLKGIVRIDLRLPDAPVLTHATHGGTVSTIPRG
jgi:cell division protein FtsQ